MEFSLWKRRLLVHKKLEKTAVSRKGRLIPVISRHARAAPSSRPGSPGIPSILMCPYPLTHRGDLLMLGRDAGLRRRESQIANSPAGVAVGIVQPLRAFLWSGDRIGAAQLPGQCLRLCAGGIFLPAGGFCRPPARNPKATLLAQECQEAPSPESRISRN